MKTADHLEILKNQFLQSAYVKDAKSGYVVAKPFNLCIDSDILEIASRCWAEHFRSENIDVIVGLPDAGARLVSILANMLGISTILPAKRSTQVPGAWENIVTYENDSFTTSLKAVKSHIGFVPAGSRILIVDDVVARGETAIAAIAALQKKKVTVVGVAVLFDKTWQGGIERIKKETGVSVFSLISIEKITSDGQITLRKQ